MRRSTSMGSLTEQQPPPIMRPEVVERNEREGTGETPFLRYYRIDTLGPRIEKLRQEIEYADLAPPGIGQMKTRLIKAQTKYARYILETVEEYYDVLNQVNGNVLEKTTDDVRVVYDVIGRICEEMTNNLSYLRSVENISDFVATAYRQLSQQEYREQKRREIAEILTNVGVSSIPVLAGGIGFLLCWGVLNLSIILTGGIAAGLFLSVGGGMLWWHQKKKIERAQGRSPMGINPFHWTPEQFMTYVRGYYDRFSNHIIANSEKLNILHCYQDYLRSYIKMFMQLPISYMDQPPEPPQAVILNYLILIQNEGENHTQSCKEMVSYLNFLTAHMVNTIRRSEDPMLQAISFINQYDNPRPNMENHWTDDVLRTLKQLDPDGYMASTIYQVITDIAFSADNFNPERFRNVVKSSNLIIVQKEIDLNVKRYTVLLDYVEDQVKRQFFDIGVVLGDQLEPVIQIFSMMEPHAHPCDLVKYWIHGLNCCNKILIRLARPRRKQSEVKLMCMACYQYTMLKSQVANWYYILHVMENFYLEEDEACVVVEPRRGQFYPPTDYFIYPHVEKDRRSISAMVGRCRTLLESMIHQEVPDDYEFFDELEDIPLDEDTDEDAEPVLVPATEAVRQMLQYAGGLPEDEDDDDMTQVNQEVDAHFRELIARASERPVGGTYTLGGDTMPRDMRTKRLEKLDPEYPRFKPSIGNKYNEIKALRLEELNLARESESD